ncbi:winged helix-turn-helix domain-containing protein [Catenovulum sp. SM1970]|nr:winged helix-turn-helix domain-containing protein [Marinifaba aquimaris]
MLLVEDDRDLAILIQAFLSKYEFNVSIVTDGIEAAKRIIDEQPDLVILDIMLPGQTGMDVCRQVRSQYQGIILMQTALDDDIDQMMGLEIGADDYIVKQVQPRLLLSRIRALLRRIQVGTTAQSENTNPSELSTNAINIGHLAINYANRSVTLSGKPVELSTAEFELLYLLATKAGQVVSRDEIVQEIKGYEYDGLDRSIDRRVSRVRKKLMDDANSPVLLKTVRGKGYQLCQP